MTGPVIDEQFLNRQMDWSQRTFGKGPRKAPVLEHIRRELIEVDANPQDATEWADVILLAMNGAMRQGHSAAHLLEQIHTKQMINESRVWPTPTGGDDPIEHIRDAGAATLDVPTLAVVEFVIEMGWPNEPEYRALARDVLNRVSLVMSAHALVWAQNQPFEGTESPNSKLNRLFRELMNQHYAKVFREISL